MRRAAVAGASGLIGGFLVRELLKSGEYDEVLALSRQTLALSDPRLKVELVDFNKLTLDVPVTDLFCTLGTTIRKAGSKEAFRAVDHDSVLNFAKWGHAHGAERFFCVTALGADSSSPIFYNRVKGEIEHDLKAIGYPALYLFRPSLLLGARTEHRTGEAWLQKVLLKLDFVFRGPLEAYRAIPAETVARAMALTAKHHVAHKGAFVSIMESKEIRATGQ